MATKAKTTTRARYRAPAADAATEVKPRTLVSDQAAAQARSIAGGIGASDLDHEKINKGPKVMVHVPKAFKLTDDGYNVHDYKSGTYPMLQVHAEHGYAKANGVTLADD